MTARRSYTRGINAPQTKLPRSIRRGPTIKVSCECGQERSLHYGERWQCESCGRKYDTNRIPLDAYAQIVRNKQRQRIFPLVIVSVMLACVIALIAVGRAFGAIIVVPFVGFLWANWLRPRRRERQLEAIRNLPTWQIRAE